MASPAEAETGLAPIQRLAVRLVYRNRFVTLHDDDVRFPSGREGRYFRVTHGDGSPPAVIMPLAGSHTALVRTWRYAVECWEWGFPRGMPQSADPAVTARLEAQEEIGADPVELLPLGRVWPDSAHLTTVAHAYLARFEPDAMAAVPSDTEEIAEVRWLPLDDLAVRIAGGEIRDGFTLSAFGLWSAWRAVANRPG